MLCSLRRSSRLAIHLVYRAPAASEYKLLNRIYNKIIYCARLVPRVTFFHVISARWRGCPLAGIQFQQVARAIKYYSPITPFNQNYTKILERYWLSAARFLNNNWMRFFDIRNY